MLQFLQLIYNGAVYQLFSTIFCKQFKLERPLMEKLKFETPQWSAWNSFILWNSKNTWFSVCESISYIVTTIMMKHANIFSWIYFNSFFLILFFYFSTSSKWSKYVAYLPLGRNFVREQFHKFLEFFAKVY